MSVAPPSGEGAAAITLHSLGCHRETQLVGPSGDGSPQTLPTTPCLRVLETLGEVSHP